MVDPSAIFTPVSLATSLGRAYLGLEAIVAKSTPTCDFRFLRQDSLGQPRYSLQITLAPRKLEFRNADGLIVVSDFNTGFWAFRLEGFQGWNGNDWNMPNISSAQNWDQSPDQPQQLR